MRASGREASIAWAITRTDSTASTSVPRAWWGESSITLRLQIAGSMPSASGVEMPLETRRMSMSV